MILQKPILSEKSMALAKNGLYSFRVDRKARKADVGRVIKEKFKVDILAVKMISYPKKVKNQRTRRSYFTVPAFKKALVKIKKGQTIPYFETPQEKTVVTTVEGGERVEVKRAVKEKKKLLKGTKIKIEKKD